MIRHFDVIVIGGGTGGLRTAFALAHHKKTLLIEPSVLGGTCLNVGCIPTKAMLFAAHQHYNAGRLARYGTKTSRPKLDFQRLMRRVHDIINEGQVHITKSMKASNLSVVKHKAQFVDKKTIRAGDSYYTAKHFIIATGAKTLLCPIPGMARKDVLTSDDVIGLKSLPASIIIIGGGYISVEFATFFAQLGCKVTIIERDDRLLKALDPDVTSLFEKLCEQKGMTLIRCANVIEMKTAKKAGGKKTIIYSQACGGKEQKEAVSAEAVLLAIGRRANKEGLHLELAGVKTDRCGIIVDERLRTSNPHILAIGDVTGRAMFAHAVKRESQVLLNNLLYPRRKIRKMDFDRMPWAIFSDPPVAGIGLTEYQASGHRIPYVVLKAPFSRVGRAEIEDQSDGFVKILYHQKTRKILGACIIGPHADDLIHEIVAVMHTPGARVDSILDAIHIHPTVAEVMGSLGPATPLTEIPVYHYAAHIGGLVKQKTRARRTTAKKQTTKKKGAKKVSRGKGFSHR